MRLLKIALLLLLGFGRISSVFAQDPAPPVSVAKSTGAVSDLVKVDAKSDDPDPRFLSPRATVKTFLNAVTQAEENPAKIEEAEACLDLSGTNEEEDNRGNLAVQLEAVLRALGLVTDLVPEKYHQRRFVYIEQADVCIALERNAGGIWRFDARTVSLTPQMRNALRLGTLKGAVISKSNTSSPPPEVPSEYGSPRDTFRTFLTAVHNHDPNRAASCFDLSEISPPARQPLGQSLALKLKEVVDRHALVVYQDIPNSYDSDSFVWMAVDQGRVELSRQPTGNRKGQWLFTTDTIRQIEPLYDHYRRKPIVREALEFEEHSSIGEFWNSPGLWVRSRVPAVLQKGLQATPGVRIEIYQLIGLIVLVLLSIRVERFVARVSLALIEWSFAFKALSLDSEATIDRLRPVGWMAAIAAAQFMISLLDLRRDVAGLVLSGLNLCFWIMAALALYRLIDVMADYAKQHGEISGKHAAMTEMLLPVLSLVLRFAVVIVGVMIVLQLFELDLAAVVTGLGIGGLAFALAAQDTLKNFFGSFTLIADRTFYVGDLVRIGTNEGTVESVGVRSTRIRTPDDSLLTIPNSELTTAHITNFGSRRFRRTRLELTVRYGTPLDRLLAFRDGILEALQAHPKSRHQGEEAVIHELCESGIKILVIIQFQVKDWHSELEAKQLLVVEILRLADELGIDLAAQPTMLLLDGEARHHAEGTGTAAARSSSRPLSRPHLPHPSRFLKDSPAF